MKKELSGLEMLEEILDRLDLIEKKIDILEQHVKDIAPSTKSTGSSVQAVAAPEPKPVKKQATAEAVDKPASMDKGFQNFKFQPTDAAKMKQDVPLVQRNRSTVNFIVVTGKMVTNIDNRVTPLVGVSVKIFDEKDALVKETKTNRSGHWVSHLAPGRYVALFEGQINGKKLIPQNRNFVVPEKLPEGKSELEII